MQKRGPCLNKVETWIATCHECHRYVEDHKNIGRAAGVIVDYRRPMIVPFTE